MCLLRGTDWMLKYNLITFFLGRAIENVSHSILDSCYLGYLSIAAWQYSLFYLQYSLFYLQYARAVFIQNCHETLTVGISHTKICYFSVFFYIEGMFIRE